MHTGGHPVTTIVVMGVSGSGKSTVAAELVERLGWDFAEGDDFHPPANVAKMRAGQPLDDEDRWPWLQTIASWIGEQEAAGRSAVVTCSALKRRYRDLLRDGHPSVWFAHVTADPELIRARVEQRTGHYMPPSLLGSQLASLEHLEPDEPGTAVSGAGSPSAVASELLSALALERPQPASIPQSTNSPRARCWASGSGRGSSTSSGRSVPSPCSLRLGIVDYTSRLAADVIKTTYAQDANESKIYFRLVWGLVAIGIVVLAVGVTQPIVLLVISAVVGGFMMFWYSGLLILINRRLLPRPIRIGGVRLGVLVWSILLFGTLSVVTFIEQGKKLFGGE